MLFSRGNKRPEYIDIHSHVSFKEYEHDRGDVLDRMRIARVHTISVGVDLETSKQAVSKAREYGEMYASIGLHPADNKDESFKPEDYRDLANDVNTVAVGECGLDYFRIKVDDEDEKARQKHEFQKQIAFAVQEKLPLMIHCRPSKGTVDAYLDILTILEDAKTEHGDDLWGNVHFFVGDTAIARRFVELNFTLSFTAVITFDDEYDEVVRQTPLSHIQAETDSPYVAPPPHRGSRNEPVNVRAVVKRIAELKGSSLEDVREILVENAYRVFDLAN